jgi:hypothetical protein
LSKQARLEWQLNTKKRQQIALVKKEKEMKIKKNFKKWTIARLQELGVPADMEMVNDQRFEKKLGYWKKQYKLWIRNDAIRALKREALMEQKLKSEKFSVKDESLPKLLGEKNGEAVHKGLVSGANDSPVGGGQVKLVAQL